MPRQNSRSSNSSSRNSHFQKKSSNNKYSNKKKGGNNNNKNDTGTAAKFEDEYDPPFVLGHIWEPQEYYKIKLSHPFLTNQIDAFNFPIAEGETRMSDRAIFAQEAVRLMKTGNFDTNNGELAYYTIERSTKGICRSDWDIVTQWREGLDDTGNDPDNSKSHEHFMQDLARWVKMHESREDIDLFQAQTAYMQRLSKPKNTSPTDYKAQFVKLNLLIPIIPGEPSSFGNDELKFLFLYSMPKNWRKKYREVGRKVSQDTLDAMAQFFDVYFKEESHSTSGSGHKKDNSHSNNHNHNHQKKDSSKSNGGRLQPDDTCPIHGGHKWKDCFDNKHGSKFKPPRSGGGGRSNEQHNTESANSGGNRDTDSRNNESASHHGNNDENPYDDNYMTEKLQLLFFPGASQRRFQRPSLRSSKVPCLK